MKSEMPQAVEALKSIVEMELAGVVRFTHYALMVRGPYRLPIVAFLQQQASESLLHAQRAGEIMTGLGGHPSMRISMIEETGQHAIKDILEESWAHEKRAIEHYKGLLEIVAGKNIFLEEYARSMVAAEEEHVMELSKMVRDFED